MGFIFSFVIRLSFVMLFIAAIIASGSGWWQMAFVAGILYVIFASKL